MREIGERSCRFAAERKGDEESKEKNVVDLGERKEESEESGTSIGGDEREKAREIREGGGKRLAACVEKGRGEGGK